MRGEARRRPRPPARCGGRRQAVAVVGEGGAARGAACRRGRGAGRAARRVARRRGAVPAASRPARRGRGAAYSRGSDQREGAALAGRAAHRDVAAQQARQVARDRQAQAGAAVLAAGGAVGLAEGLEDQVLLLGRDADAACRAPRSAMRPSAPRAHVQRHAAVLGELDRVRQQVLQDLLEALAVGVDAWPARPARLARRTAGPSARASGSNMLRRPSATRRSGDGFGAHFQLAGLDLGEVEDVVDQGQQVVAGRVDRLGELDLLVVRLPSRLSASSLARISELLSGVRSSCDMLARNSDL